MDESSVERPGSTSSGKNRTKGSPDQPDKGSSVRASLEKLPIVVDLDRTLLTGDSLHEAILHLLFRNAKAIRNAISALRRDRYELKEFLATIKAYSAEHSPIRQDLLEFLIEQKAKGRPIHLYTAAHESVAHAVAERLGFFQSSVGSADGANLNGRRKAERLRSEFGGDFVYAGDSHADLAVWKQARGAIPVGVSGRVRRKLDALGVPLEREFYNESVSGRDWLRVLRIHQWAKNILLFVPLILAHQYLELQAFVSISLGFLCMGLVASSTYIFNDLADLRDDRQHATKRYRPIASGAVSIKVASVTAVTLFFAGMLGALLLNPAFAALVTIYVVLTISYSIRVKAIPLLDVFVLGMLYTIRIFMGTVLLGIPASPWLLVFSLFFFYSLSIAKRHVEIVKSANASKERIAGRGYRASDAPLTLALGISSSVAAVLLLFLYVVNDAYPAQAYRSPEWLWAIAFVVFLWTGRIWLKSHRGRLDDDPVLFALKDPTSWTLGGAIMVLFVLAVI